MAIILFHITWLRGWTRKENVVLFYDTGGAIHFHVSEPDKLPGTEHKLVINLRNQPSIVGVQCSENSSTMTDDHTTPTKQLMSCLSTMSSLCRQSAVAQFLQIYCEKHPGS